MAAALLPSGVTDATEEDPGEGGVAAPGGKADAEPPFAAAAETPFGDEDPE